MYRLKDSVPDVAIKKGSDTIPGVAVATKMGRVFLFNRVTGDPLFPVEECVGTSSEEILHPPRAGRARNPARFSVSTERFFEAVEGLQSRPTGIPGREEDFPRKKTSTLLQLRGFPVWLKAEN